MYRLGSLNEPPSLNEPAAILGVELSPDLLHLMYGCRYIVSTVEKIGVGVAVGIPKIYRFC